MASRGPPVGRDPGFHGRDVLFAQQRLDKGINVVRDEGGAFGGWVDSVGLHGVGNGVDVVEDEGQQRHVELFGGKYVGLVDGLNVVLAVVGREGDAGECNFDTGVLQRGDDFVEVRAGRGDGKAAESVVASELDDDDGGVCGKDVVNAIDAVFGGVSADAHVQDAIVIAM